MRHAGRALAALLAVAAAVPASLVGADSFTPVRLAVRIARVARLHQPLAVTVAVSADAGVLDNLDSPLALEVKLAPECGGVYRYTPGVTLLDKQLKPQPSVGQPYAASAGGTGKPSAYGEQTVCVWLVEQSDQRVFASDQSLQVNVSKPCTADAARYDRARRVLARDRKQHRSTTKATRLVNRTHRAALKACGPGVPL